MRIDRISLNVAMARSDVSMRELEKLSGVNYATISFIRNGKSCREETAQRIAKALNVRMDELVAKEG